MLKTLYVLFAGRGMNPLLERLSVRNVSHSHSSASLPHPRNDDSDSDAPGTPASIEETGQTGSDSDDGGDSSNSNPISSPDDSRDGQACTHEILTKTGSNAVWVKLSCKSCGYIYANRPRKADEQSIQSKRRKM